MFTYGRTDQEKKTNLSNYNHALFNNMATPIAVIWEISPTNNTACVMHDIYKPELVGEEYFFDAMVQGMEKDMRIAEDDTTVSDRLEVSELLMLKEQTEFVVLGNVDTPKETLYRLILTPLLNDEGRVEKVYMSVMDTLTDPNSVADVIVKAKTRPEKVLTASMAAVVFFVVVVFACVTGIKAIMDAVAIGEAGSAIMTLIILCGIMFIAHCIIIYSSLKTRKRKGN